MCNTDLHDTKKMLSLWQLLYYSILLLYVILKKTHQTMDRKETFADTFMLYFHSPHAFLLYLYETDM